VESLAGKIPKGEDLLPSRQWHLQWGQLDALALPCGSVCEDVDPEPGIRRYGADQFTPDSNFDDRNRIHDYSEL
jgi:hypothetical protein